MPVVKTGRSSTVNGRFGGTKLTVTPRNDNAKPDGKMTKGTDFIAKKQKAPH